MFEILIFLFLIQVIVLVSKLDFVICTTLCDIYMIPLLFQLCKGKGGLIAIWHMISNAIFPNLIIGFGLWSMCSYQPASFVFHLTDFKNLMLLFSPLGCQIIYIRLCIVYILF